MTRLNDKKEYISPSAEIERFFINSMITTSGGQGEFGEGEDTIDAILERGDGTIYYLDENGDVIDKSELDSIF